MDERTASDVELASRWAAPPAPADAEALRNLLQAYAIFTDAGAVDAVAELFTQDAEWDGTDLGYGSATGPAAIARHVVAHHRPDQPMVHLPGPPLLTAVSENDVDAASWCLATRWADDGPRPLIYFSYEDRLTRVADGWRFRRRLLRATFPSAGA